METILVTGGAGFIGSAVIRHFISGTDYSVVNVDKLTYAGHLESLGDVDGSDRYTFEHADICDIKKIRKLIQKHQPHAVIHLAAESHVDRSIDGASEFINTNINGTYILLEELRDYWKSLSGKKKDEFLFLHVSTDEVFGSLGSGGLFTEETPYDPRSPYSSSKAASDHLVRAWYHTYGFPILITNCSNNYGPYQFPEKLIPVVILKALQGQKIPVYGKGDNVRDWLYVDDHAKALQIVLEKGSPGETYNVGGNTEKQNIEVVQTICDVLDQLVLKEDGAPYSDQITFVSDRPGHDFRYAIDATKIKNSLGWEPNETFETGIMKTVQWYLEHMDWVKTVTGKHYNFERLGINI